MMRSSIERATLSHVYLPDGRGAAWHIGTHAIELDTEAGSCA